MTSIAVAGCLAITTLASVRTGEPRIAEAVQRLVRQSPTAAMLADRIEHSDLIVYVEPGRCPSPRARSCFTVLPVPPGRRYARITVPFDVPPFRLASLIGHELQHAVEVADAPSVVDPQTLAQWFGRIGHRLDAVTFETPAAAMVEHAIIRELTAAGRFTCGTVPSV
jgi:hypothetical protein